MTDPGSAAKANASLDIVIAEDSLILRDGLIALVTWRGHRATGVGAAAALQAEIARRITAGIELPDVVVADIRMPPSFSDEGLRAALTLRAQHPRLPVLLFSQYIETRYAAQLLAGDARGVGYLLKDRVTDVNDFLTALERVAAGETVLDPEVVAQLMSAQLRPKAAPTRKDTDTRPDTATASSNRQLTNRGAWHRSAPPHTTDRLARLTSREREVLALMAEGRSNAAIASALYLSEGAVEKKVAAIFAKLHLDIKSTDNRRVLAVLRYLGL